nr:DUF664 domain-containing protein [Rhodococcus sp. BS-15]
MERRCSTSAQARTRSNWHDVRSRPRLGSMSFHPMSLRMVYVHMIGEYARHNGHADIIREQIDGVIGR